MMSYIKLIIKLDKIDKHKPILIVKDIVLYFNYLFKSSIYGSKAGSRGSKQDTVFLLSVYTRLP